MINPDDGQWLTYREAAVVLGLTPEGVRWLARRKGWSRQTATRSAASRACCCRLASIDGNGRTRPTQQPGFPDRIASRHRRAYRSRNSSEDGPGNGAVDRAGFPAGELAVEVALLRERIADKDIHIADLRSRFDAPIGGWMLRWRLNGRPLTRLRRCGRQSTSAVLGGCCAASTQR